MKETIRFNTFETNSSSSHCISFVNSERYNRFINGELYIVFYPYGLSKESVEKYNEENKDLRKRAKKYQLNTPCYLYTKEELYREWLKEQQEYCNRISFKPYRSFNDYLYTYYKLDRQGVDIKEFSNTGLTFELFEKLFSLFTNDLNIYTYQEFLDNCYDENESEYPGKLIVKGLFFKKKTMLDYYFRLT